MGFPNQRRQGSVGSAGSRATSHTGRAGSAGRWSATSSMGSAGKGLQSAGDRGLNLSFGNFEFREFITPAAGKKGGGIVQLHAQLSRAKREKTRLDSALDSSEGIEERRATLIDKAATRMGGTKLKDDPTMLARKLNKRRSKKRRSARQWAKRVDDIRKSVDEVGESRSAMASSKKAMMHANRNRRLAQKELTTSAGRKEKAKRMSGAGRKAAAAGKKKPAGGGASRTPKKGAAAKGGAKKGGAKKGGAKKGGAGGGKFGGKGGAKARRK